MSDLQVASIIVNNYNYGRFLQEAIDSALNQTYPLTEVIVVDDGSTDNSREVIATYGTRIIPILKENGGMASTYNAGLPASRGQVVLFLDSDDIVLPTAVAEALKLFDGPEVVNVHWPLREIDKNGRETGKLIPSQALSEGDFRAAIIRAGPAACVTAPTTGNAWSRPFLEEVLPAPEREFRQHADTYLNTLAPACGIIRTVWHPQGCHRIHGCNDFASKPSDEKNRRNLAIYHHCCVALSKNLGTRGIDIDPETWEQGNAYYEWMQEEYLATEEMKSLIPPGSSFILVDDGNWAENREGTDVIKDRRAIPFLERNRQYWGAPPDDETGIRELERLRQDGARFMVFAWPAFWWLDYYLGLLGHLRSNFHCVLENKRLVVFDLGS
jgi:glycosyltransferase involved in cell wall biosynthesis